MYNLHYSLDIVNCVFMTQSFVSLIVWYVKMYLILKDNIYVFFVAYT